MYFMYPSKSQQRGCHLVINFYNPRQDLLELSTAAMSSAEILKFEFLIKKFIQKS